MKLHYITASDRNQRANINGDVDDTDKIATSCYLETNFPTSIIQLIFSLR
jgi:hypothetical protein